MPLYWSAEWSMLFPEASFPEKLNMIWDGSRVALASLFWVILNITLAVFVLELYVTLRGTEEMLASEGLVGIPQLYAPPESEPDVRRITQFEMFCTDSASMALLKVKFIVNVLEESGLDRSEFMLDTRVPGPNTGRKPPELYAAINFGDATLLM